MNPKKYKSKEINTENNNMNLIGATISVRPNYQHILYR